MRTPQRFLLRKHFFIDFFMFFKNNNWEYALLLYVEKAEVSEIETTLKNTIYRQNQMILFISMNSVILTIAVVICFCYNVAMSISRPLRKLIKIASMINNNATQKNRVANIQEELPMVKNFYENFTVFAKFNYFRKISIFFKISKFHLFFNIFHHFRENIK